MKTTAQPQKNQRHKTAKIVTTKARSHSKENPKSARSTTASSKSLLKPRSTKPTARIAARQTSEPRILNIQQIIDPKVLQDCSNLKNEPPCFSPIAMPQTLTQITEPDLGFDPISSEQLGWNIAIQHDAYKLKLKAWQSLRMYVCENQTNFVQSAIYTERVTSTNVFNTTSKRKLNFNNSAQDPMCISVDVTSPAFGSRLTKRSRLFNDSRSSNQTKNLNELADQMRRMTLLLKSFVVLRRYTKVNKLEHQLEQFDKQAQNHYEYGLMLKAFQSLYLNPNTIKSSPPAEGPLTNLQNQQEIGVQSDNFNWLAQKTCDAADLQSILEKKVENADLHALIESDINNAVQTQRTVKRNYQFQNALFSDRLHSNATSELLVSLESQPKILSNDSYLRILALGNNFEQKTKSKVFKALRKHCEKQKVPEIRNAKLLGDSFRKLKANAREERLSKLELKHRIKHVYGMKKEWLKKWERVTKMCWEARKHSRRRILKFGVNELKKNVRYQRNLKEGVQRMNLRRMQKCFTALSDQRSLELTRNMEHSQILYLQKCIKLKRVFKVWFNQVCLTKKYKKLSQIASKYTDDSVMRSTLKQWQFATHLQDLRTRVANRLKHLYFDQWLRSALQKRQQKAAHTIDKAIALNKKAFDSWKLFYVVQKERKEKLLKICRLRAYSLLQLAFNEGLKPYLAQKRLKKQLIKLASVMLAKRLQKTALQAFKNMISLKRKQKLTEKKHAYLLTKALIKEWSINTKLHKRLRKSIHKLETKSTHSCFRALKVYYLKKKQLKLNVELMLKTYGQKLQKLVFQGFKQMIEIKRSVDEQLNMARCHHNRNLAHSILKWMAEYTLERRWGRFIVKEFREEQQTKNKKICFDQLVRNVMIMRIKKKGLPFKQRLERELKLKYLDLMYNLSQDALVQRKIISEFQREIKLKQSAFYFGILSQYCFNKKYKKHLNQQATLFTQFHSKKKALKALMMNKLHKDEASNLTQCVQSNLRGTIFARWYNYIHDYLPKLAAAKLHFKRQLFTAFWKITEEKRPTRQQRRKLVIYQRNFSKQRLAYQGLTMLYLHSQKSMYYKSKLELGKKIWLKQLYSAWVQQTPIMKVKREMKEKVTGFRNLKLAAKVFKSLQSYNCRKRLNRSRIAEIQTKKNLSLMFKCLAILIDSAHETKLKALQFVDLVTPVSMKLKAIALCNWIRCHQEAMQRELAHQFFMQKTGLSICKKAIEGLKEYFLYRKSKKTRNTLAQLHYQSKSLKSCLYKLRLHASNTRTKSQMIGLMRHKTKIRIMQTVVFEWQNYVDNRQLLKYKQAALTGLYANRLKRTSLYCLLKHRQTKNVERLVQHKHEQSFKQFVMLEWLQLLAFKLKIKKAVELFESEHQKRLVYAALPRIEKSGKFMQIRSHSVKSRSMELLQNAFKEFKLILERKQIKEQLVQNFIKQKQIKLFKAIKQTLESQKTYRERVDSVITHQQLQDQHQLKQTCYKALSNHRIYKKAKKTADFLASKSLEQKAFSALKDYNMRRKFYQSKEYEFLQLIKKKYLILWLQAQALNPRETQARQILNFSKLNKCFIALHSHHSQEQKVKQFRSRWQNKRLEFQVIRGLQRNVVIKQFQQMVYEKINQKHQLFLMKATFDLFAQSCKGQQLTSGLVVFSNQKLLKKYLLALREYTLYKNNMRLHLIKLRALFSQKAYLSRPLLVLKKFLLFKAFNALRQKTYQLRMERDQSQLSHYAAYLSLQRKAFYALRLNAAEKFQNHTTIRLNKLFIQRRALRGLRQACQLSKKRKENEQKAMLCRFLSLQKRVFTILRINVAQQKQQRILETFAATLYYKSLCSRVFLSLKIYALAIRQEEQEQTFAPGHLLPHTVMDNIDQHQIVGREVQRLYMEEPIENTNKQSAVHFSTSYDGHRHSSLTNDFVISQAEMGPISVQNYEKFKDLPKTMLEDKQSQCSSKNISRGPSALSMLQLPLSPGSDEN